MFNTLSHLYAASLVRSNSNNAHLGFYIVACASFIGTLRFGFAETLLSKMNGNLADYAAIVGLPLIGLSTLSEIPGGVHSTELIVNLSILYIMIQSISLSESIKKLIKICFFHDF